MRLAPLPLLVLLAACAEFPALDARLTEADRSAPYPALVPLGPLLASADPGTAPPTGDLSARVASLAARADALRRPVIDATTSDRIADALR